MVKYRELLKETRSAKKALEVAINFEMGIQNRLKISGKSTHATLNQAPNISVNSNQNSLNRPRPSSNTSAKPTICPNCGYGLSVSHRQNCFGHGKNCKNGGIANHFAKVCRKTKVQMKPKPRVNNVDDTTSEATTIVTSATAGEQLNQIETMFQRHSVYDANSDSYYDEFDDKCVFLISDGGNIREVYQLMYTFAYEIQRRKH